MTSWRNAPGIRFIVPVGIAGVIIATVVSALTHSDDPGSKAPLYIGAGGVCAVMGAYLLYGWVSIFLGREGIDDPIVIPEDPNVAPTGWVSLLWALEPDTEKFERSRKAFKEIGEGAVKYYGLIFGLGFAVIAGAVMHIFLGLDGAWYPFGPTGLGIPYAFAPVFGVLLYMLATLPRRLAWAFRIGREATAPLGLSEIAYPQLVLTPGGDNTLLVGATIMGGYRHDRRVEVALRGSHHTVGLGGDFPAFAVRGDDDGRLTTRSDAPTTVTALLAAMPADPRWRGIEIDANTQGLTVRRSGSGTEARERWLEDLWLAERVAGAVQERGQTPILHPLQSAA